VPLAGLTIYMKKPRRSHVHVGEKYNLQIDLDTVFLFCAEY
jgi:hypothetical protein